MYRDNNSNPWIVSRNQKDLISLKLQFYYEKVIVRKEIYIYLIYSKSVLKYAFEKETFQSPIKHIRVYSFQEQAENKKKPWQ